MELKLTDRDIWLSTLVFGGIGILLTLPLLSLYSDGRFMNAARSTALSSAAFWGIMSLVLMGRFWDIYYHYIYPDWMRSIRLSNVLLYAAIGLGMWKLAFIFENQLVLAFCVFGGLEGVAEHIFAVFGLHVLEKVPFLRGLKPFPVILFSFFEYIVYWSVVAWMALGLAYLLPLLTD
jgi:hypothetical protein